MTHSPEQERLRRWRLILGGGEADGITGQGSGQPGQGDAGGGLNERDQGMDDALAALYDSERRGGLGGSNPDVARWLGNIREYFPTSVVRVMQRDALQRLNLRRLLLEPELLEAVEPDIHLVADLISLGRLIPNKTKDTARMVVRQVVEKLVQKLHNPVRQAVTGSLSRATRNNRPRHNEIDWHRTIRRNLKHYQPDYRTIIPELLVGFGRKRSQLRNIVLCVDQSGSMATSVVYASIFAAVLASIPAVKTHLVVFDTAVVDLTDALEDPVEVLFGTQLGGGTDINRALGYCQTIISRPQDTILVLISDLYEGGNRHELLRRAGTVVDSGVQFVTLLALNDDGAPSYDHRIADQFTDLGIPSFACTPDLFPDLMAATINRQDISQWAAKNELVTVGSKRE